MAVHFLHYPKLTLDQAIGACAIAVGVFDGVHAGHRAVIAQAQAQAARLGGTAGVLTFVEHPRQVLRPDQPVPLLTPWPEKLAMLEGLGISDVVAVHFTPGFAQLSPEAFVSQVLVGQLGVKALATGFNFRFGHEQGGDAEALRRLAAPFGVEVAIAPPLLVDGEVASSSRLRAMIGKGEVALAAKLLGRPYVLEGEVVGGDRRGRTIGFPTANQQAPEGKLLPAFGVYASWAILPDGTRVPAVTNVGQRPTFDPPKLVVETHLLGGWSGDLYGQALRVALVDRLRPEQAFSGIEALVAQIRADAAQATALLAAHA